MDHIYLYSSIITYRDKSDGQVEAYTTHWNITNQTDFTMLY